MLVETTYLVVGMYNRVRIKKTALKIKSISCSVLVGDFVILAVFFFFFVLFIMRYPILFQDFYDYRDGNGGVPPFLLLFFYYMSQSSWSKNWLLVTLMRLNLQLSCFHLRTPMMLSFVKYKIINHHN